MLGLGIQDIPGLDQALEVVVFEFAGVGGKLDPHWLVGVGRRRIRFVTEVPDLVFL